MSRPPYVSVHIASATPGRRLAARDIVEAYAGEIRAGRLPAGCRLPPVRALERQLGLSKNTVQAAYDELVARGLLESRERDGVFVAPAEEIASSIAMTTPPPLPRLKPVPMLFQEPWDPAVLHLSSVFIDPDLLPKSELADCLRSVLRHPGMEPFYDFQGLPALRTAIAQRLQRRGMEVTADQIITTVGSQQAIDIVARSLQIQRVAMENPVYGHARALFERSGMQSVGLPLDPFAGIDLDDWDRTLAQTRPGLLYAITSFQNPTGYSYSSHELERLLALAARHDVALLEDDWGSDMLSDSEYRPTLRLMGGPNVLYVNSFTKKVWPAMRIGYLVAPAAMVPSLVAQKRLSTLGTPPLLEAAMAEFLDRGYYDTHLGRLQVELDRRYEACLEMLREHLPAHPELRWTTPGGGPTLWLDIPRNIDLSALRAALLARGVHIEDSRVAFFGQPHLHGFRISYAHAPVEAVSRGIVAVADEVRKRLH